MLSIILFSLTNSILFIKLIIFICTGTNEVFTYFNQINKHVLSERKETIFAICLRRWYCWTAFPIKTLVIHKCNAKICADYILFDIWLGSAFRRLSHEQEMQVISQYMFMWSINLWIRRLRALATQVTHKAPKLNPIWRLRLWEWWWWWRCNGFLYLTRIQSNETLPMHARQIFSM